MHILFEVLSRHASKVMGDSILFYIREKTSQVDFAEFSPGKGGDHT